MKSDREIYFEIRMVKNEIRELKKRKKLSVIEKNRLNFLVSGPYWLKWAIKSKGD